MKTAENSGASEKLHRREFFQAARPTLAVAGTAAVSTASADARPLTEDEKLSRIASNAYPIRWTSNEEAAPAK